MDCCFDSYFILYCEKTTTHKQTNKQTNAYLNCLEINLCSKIQQKIKLIKLDKISFCNWLRSNFMILTLFSYKKQFNQLVFCNWGTRKSARVVSLNINYCSTSLRQRLDQVVNQWRWNGSSLLLKCLEKLSASNKSVQLVPKVFDWV